MACGCGTGASSGGPLLSGVLAPQYGETGGGGGDGVVVSQADVAQASLTAVPAGKLCVPCVVFWIFVAGVAWYAFSKRKSE